MDAITLILSSLILGHSNSSIIQVGSVWPPGVSPAIPSLEGEMLPFGPAPKNLVQPVTSRCRLLPKPDMLLRPI